MKLLIPLMTALTGLAHAQCVPNSSTLCVTMNNETQAPLYMVLVTSKTQQYYQFDQQAYTPSFSSKTVARGKTTLLLKTQKLNEGARLYIATTPWNGKTPDLSTDTHRYEKVELGWGDSSVWNTTHVDFFGLPVTLSQGGKQTGFIDGTTLTQTDDALVSAMNQQPEIYGSTGSTQRSWFIKKNAQGQIVRIYSPAYVMNTHPGAIKAPKANQWITQSLATLSQSHAEVDYGGNHYHNFHTDPAGNTLTADMTGADGQTQSITLSSLTEVNALAGTIAFTTGGGQFAGMIASAIFRGVLANPSAWGDPSQYYPEDAANGNAYSQVLHTLAFDHKIYANSYDDFWNQGSTLPINTHHIEPVTITIHPLQ